MNIKKIALYVVPSVIGIFLLLWGCRQIAAYRQYKNPTLSKRRMNHRFAGLRNMFITFAQGIQAIGCLFESKIKSIATRSRYKKRGSFYTENHSSYQKSNRKRSTSIDYTLKTTPHSGADYSNSPEYKRKNVVFHDVNK